MTREARILRLLEAFPWVRREVAEQIVDRWIRHGR